MSQADEMAVARNWYKLLNCGLRCAISAGTDSFVNIIYHLVPGAERVYVRTGARLDYAKWIAAYRQGNSFATNGPMLTLTVNGNEPGDDFHLPAGPASLIVRAEASSQLPMDRLEILVNGKVVETVSGARDRLSIARNIPIGGSSWVAARVTGPAHRLLTNDNALFAHTSPVYCYTGERRIESREDARDILLWIDRLMDRVSSQALIRSPEQRKEVLESFRQGRAYYARMAE
jgi:TolB protein